MLVCADRKVSWLWFSRQMIRQLEGLSIVSELLGEDIVITGAQDEFYFEGLHQAHRDGCALDIRCRMWPRELREKFAAYVVSWCLTSTKVRVLDDPAHIHVEWEPAI